MPSVAGGVERMKNFLLVGAPNSGKTTLYNWLTGSHFRAVNYPGSTVEFSTGKLSRRWSNSVEIELTDTPGTYSLFPKSPDEEITLRLLVEKKSPVVAVVDGTQIERHLLLVRQLLQAGFQVTVALTMKDLLQKAGWKLDLKVLGAELGVPVFEINGLTGEGISDLVRHLQSQENRESLIQIPEIWSLAQRSQEKSLVQSWLRKAGFEPRSLHKVSDTTRKWDRLLLHPYLGFPIFFLIMTGLFVTIFWVAAPFMDLLDSSFSMLAEWVYGLQNQSLLLDFLSHGLILGLSAVLVFVPQILFLFLAMGFLESTGYLARAAVLVDRPLSKIGLSGRSFVPLLSGFACAVPALMASRNVDSPRDRRITNWIIPLMTCSARIPVYSLLVLFLFRDQGPWAQGLFLAGIYVASMLLGAVAAALLHRFLPKTQTSMFVLEMPLYRRPRWKVLLQQALMRTRSYVQRAGPVIFVLSVFIWIGTNFPQHEKSNETVRLQQSYLGQLGKAIDPVFEPMGVDWRVGVALMSAFAAREVFVSSLAVVFQAADKDPETQQKGLLQVMQTAKNKDGSMIFSVGSVLGLIVFFMIALQCMSTVVTSARESGSWRSAGLQLLVLNVIAYVAAVTIYFYA